MLEADAVDAGDEERCGIAVGIPREMADGAEREFGYRLGREFVAHGYRWVTEHEGPTSSFFSFDHIFLLGLGDHANTGVVRDTLQASDHRPVWAVMALAADLPQPFTQSSGTGP